MTIFQESEWNEILKRLEKGTKAGVIKWEATGEARDNFLAVPDGRTRYRIRSRDRDGKFPFILDILSDNDTVVDSYQAQPFDPDHIGSIEEANSMLIDDLRTEAQRQASGAAAAFEEIINSLDEIVGKDEQPF